MSRARKRVLIGTRTAPILCTANATKGDLQDFHCVPAAMEPPEMWVPDGYIVINVDSRGAGKSPGRLDPNSAVVERSYGSFSRAIPLPFDPDPTKVEAKFDKGVLHIHLPKPAEVAKKQQKIEIKKA